MTARLRQLPGGALDVASPGGGLSVGARRAIVAMAGVLLCLIALWPTTVTLIERWQDTVHRTYTHGFVVLLVTLWLLWRGRSRWEYCAVAPAAWAGALLVALGFVWLIAHRAGLQIVHQALFPPMVIAALTACFGTALVRRMLLPLLFLYFAVPVWDAINPLLQWISVFAVRLILRIADIPVYFVGSTFHIPAGSFEIAGGCSGLHFFVVAATIGVLHGELERDDLRTRIKLVALACALAMLTNWVRVFIIVIAGHLTQMQHHLVSDEHYSFGWFMFAGTMVAYFLITRRWIAGVAPAPAAAPVQNSRPVPRAGIVSALVALAVVPAWNLLDPGSAPADYPALLPRAEAVEPFEGGGGGVWRPRFVGADREQLATWRFADTFVEGYAAAYGFQRQGKELIGYENSIYGDSLSAGSTLAAPRPWAASQATDARGGSWLLWRAYRLDEQWHSRALPLQLQYAVRSLFASPVASVIVIRTRCAEHTCDDAQETLRRFTARHWATAGGSP